MSNLDAADRNEQISRDREYGAALEDGQQAFFDTCSDMLAQLSLRDFWGYAHEAFEDKERQRISQRVARAAMAELIACAGVPVRIEQHFDMPKGPARELQEQLRAALPGLQLIDPNSVPGAERLVAWLEENLREAARG